MPAITKPNQHFDATTQSGTSAAQTITNAGAFQPDLVWGKNRTNVNGNRLTDSVRGTGKVLFSDTTNGDTTGDGQLSSFNSNGFGLTGGSGAFEGLNQSGNNYVAWQWKAGGAAVTNTAGSITSQVSANPTAGFSVVTYTSTTGTVGHGLSVAPSMIIMKGRNVTDQWTIGHKSLNGGSSPWNYGLPFSDASTQTNSGFWNNTAPTSTVFSQGSWNSGYTKVAYCFAEIAGYSAFGSYTGTGNSDGPFVYCGFKPAFVMIKANASGYHWYTIDNKRPGYNTISYRLFPSTSDSEITSGDTQMDLLSNGFKLRAGNSNYAGTVFYAAFAEAPFKYSSAR